MSSLLMLALLRCHCLPALPSHLPEVATLTFLSLLSNPDPPSPLFSPCFSLYPTYHVWFFTYLKHTVHWFLVYAQSCATMGTVPCSIFSSPQRDPIPISSHSAFPSDSPSPWQSPVFLTQEICSFWTFHVSGITQYVVLCDWLLSHSVFQG